MKTFIALLLTLFAAPIFAQTSGGYPSSPRFNSIHVYGASNGVNGTVIYAASNSGICSYVSTTTLANCVGLSVTLQENGTYYYEMLLSFNAVVTGTQGIKFCLNATPNGVNFLHSYMVGAVNNAFINSGAGISSPPSCGAPISFATLNTVANQDNVVMFGTLNTAGIGGQTVTVQAAQNSSSANASAINVASYIYFVRLF